MKDRASKYPGRVKLTPVSGQTNIYTMERMDQPTELGTPISKATLLRDDTAALYGLDGNATPDNVLQAIYAKKRTRAEPSRRSCLRSPGRRTPICRSMFTSWRWRA